MRSLPAKGGLETSPPSSTATAAALLIRGRPALGSLITGALALIRVRWSRLPPQEPDDKLGTLDFLLVLVRVGRFVLVFGGAAHVRTRDVGTSTGALVAAGRDAAQATPAIASTGFPPLGGSRLRARRIILLLVRVIAR